MGKIVECVPNFSEGRNKEIIDAIASAIRNTSGVSLLDVDPGSSTNRTVYTFVGSPEAVVRGALNGAKIAFKLINMSQHKGEHPRMGALDVCPFIPVRDVSVEECIACAKQFGELLSQELNVPVYLYGMAAEKGDYRTTLPQIRAGEYEALKDKLQKAEWAPDFGPAEFVANWGATATGVRKFLIAYNINVLGTKEQAHRIALNLREQGRGPNEPGRLKATQGIGWWLEEANMAQISLNLVDHDITPLHVAYEEACKDAREMNVAITGSEIVGLLPLKGLLQVANYYIEKEKLIVLEEDQKVHLAINRLGLSSIAQFKPKERIIEYRLQDEGEGNLSNLSVDKFVRSVAARSPAPGGGSVSALVGSLGCALATMVAQMTFGKRQWEHLESQIRLILPVVFQAMEEAIPMIDADTEAFNLYMAAMKLPQRTQEEKSAREVAMQEGLRQAVQVPLKLAQHLNSVWPHVIALARIGNINCKSDLQVGAECLRAGVKGAIYNVSINIDGITDDDFKSGIHAEMRKQTEAAQTQMKQVLQELDARKDETPVTSS